MDEGEEERLLTDWGHLTLAEGALGEGEDEEVWSEETREGEEFSEVSSWQ